MTPGITAWLMVGQPLHKKRERRARWNHEVLPLSGPAQVERALEIFASELEEDRRP